MDKFRSESAENNRADIFFMQQALSKAASAAESGELPVGAVIVYNGEIIAAVSNQTETDCSATSHAEINAITAACTALGSKTLDDCTLYVTLEPCPMCAGAIYLSRIKRIVYGASDMEYGAVGGKFDLFEMSGFEAHRPAVTGGVLADECSLLLRNFFRIKRTMSIL